MKKFLFAIFAIVLLAVPVCAQAAPPAGVNTSIVASWVPNDNGNPACGGTVTKACVWGRTLTLTPPSGVTGGNVVVPSCSATVTTNCIGVVSAYTWAPGGNLFCGTWGLSLVTNYADAAGTAQVTLPAATGSVVEPCPFVPPASPSSISASVK